MTGHFLLYGEKDHPLKLANYKMASDADGAVITITVTVRDHTTAGFAMQDLRNVWSGQRGIAPLPKPKG